MNSLLTYFQRGRGHIWFRTRTSPSHRPRARHQAMTTSRFDVHLYVAWFRRAHMYMYFRGKTEFTHVYANYMFEGSVARLQVYYVVASL